MMTPEKAGSHESGTETPSAEDVRSQLERIVTSPHFVSAERSKRFLGFLVEEALAGRHDRLKEYTLAVEVFDRDDSFDPSTNPSVRVEASRLRRRLEHYYLTLGREDPILVRIPRGSYVPEFRANGDVLHLQKDLAALDPKKRLDLTVGAHGRPWIAVLPFTNVDAGESVFAHGVTVEIITALSRFRDFHVIAQNTTFRHDGQDHAARIGRHLGAHYVLQGNVQRDHERIRIHGTLSRGTSGEVLWAERYERDLEVESIFEVQEEIASRVAASITLPQGAIVQPELARARRKPLKSLNAYDTLLLFHDYATKMSPATHTRVLEAIEPTLQAEPDSATLHAIRAFLYLHMFRYGFNVRGTSSKALQEAMSSGRKAVKLDPLNPRGHHALALAHFSNGNRRAFRSTAKRALELNPNDADMLASFGLHFILSDDLELGRILMKVALTLNPLPPDSYWFAFFWLHFILGEFEEALDMVLHIQNEDFYLAHCVQAVAYSRLGMKAAARDAVERLVRVNPEFASHASHELMHWLGASRTAEVLALLRDAGLNLD